jgi:hypothetical protein
MNSVAAAAAQQYPPTQFQVFVLDDAADENLRKAVDVLNTSSCIRKFGFQDVVYFARKKPPGQPHYYKSGNLRAGLEFTASNHGSSEYFAALDADMISEPDWLSRTVPHLVKNKDIALVSPPQISYNILQDDKLCQDSNVYAQILEPSRDFFGCSQCSGSGYVMRRCALESIGGWPRANIGEDIMCSNMLQEQGWKTKYIPDQLQFGLAPDSFHGYINQRSRWVSSFSGTTNQGCRSIANGLTQTYGSLLVGKHFGLGFGKGDKRTAVQRALSLMGPFKACVSPLVFAAAICLPICAWVLQARVVELTVERRHLRLILGCNFVASMISKKLVYGRLGSMNVSNMTTSRLWTLPCKILSP